jgi:hypothetical protein
MKPVHGWKFKDFFEAELKKRSEPEEDFEADEADEITRANLDIKDRLYFHIKQMTIKASGDIESIRLQIKEADRIRVEQEVEELLADEQRSTSMGQWA